MTMTTTAPTLHGIEDPTPMRERRGNSRPRLRTVGLHRTRTLVVLRHALAAPRDTWDGDDLDRPLVDEGRVRADELTTMLGAHGVTRVVSAPALRCVQTVEPYADAVGTFLEIDDRLGERTRFTDVDRSVGTLLDHPMSAVVCTHRPTLPWMFAALGTDPVDLRPGAGLVLHHRKGVVLAVEPLGRPSDQQP